MCGFVVGVGCGPPDAPDAPGTSGRLDGRICTVGTVDTVAFGHRRGAFWGRAQGAPGGAMGAPWTPGAPGIRGSGMGTDKGPDLGAVGTMGTPWRVPGATVGTWFGTGRAGGTHQGHRGAGRVWARFAQLVGASGVRGLGCWSGTEEVHFGPGHRARQGVQWGHRGHRVHRESGAAGWEPIRGPIWVPWGRWGHHGGCQGQRWAPGLAQGGLVGRTRGTAGRGGYGHGLHSWWVHRV